MKAEPYKIIAEFHIIPNSKGDAVDIQAFYVCDCEACEECGSGCYLTTDINHAKHYSV